MVTLLLDSSQLDVVLSLTERALSFRTADLHIDRSHIRKVQLTDDAWTWLRGVPGPGTQIKGVLAMGTWRSAGGADFVIVRRRRPAVVIDLEGDPQFQRIVLTTRHGLALIQALRLDADDEPVEVSEIVTAAIPTTTTPEPSPAVGSGRGAKARPATA